MKELIRHIEILLLHNDCVIVPDLGGFIAHHVSARIDDTGKMFVAPCRSLGFNPLLNMSDSLLAESYMTVHDISYPDALKYIRHEVEQLKMQLEHDGVCELGDLGIFRVKEDGHYEFSPCIRGILSPKLYGFSAIELPQSSSLAASTKQREACPAANIMMPLHPHSSNTSQHSLATIMSQIDNNNNSEEKTISIKVSVLRNIAVTAVAAIALVLFARPVAPNELADTNSTQAEAGMISVANTKDAESSVDMEMPSIMPETKILDNIQDLAKKIESIKKKDTCPSVGNYTIVLGCSLPLDNAKAYLSHVHENGITEATLFEYHSDNMIVYGNYSKSSDALPHLNELAQQGFSGWIMEVKP